MNYAKALRTVRAINGVTQKRLAEMLDVDQGYISRIEDGQRKPSLELLENIADKLKLPLHSLLLLSYEKKDLNGSSLSEVGLIGKQILEVVSGV